MKNLFFVILINLSVCAVFAQSPAGSGALKVGASKSDISPSAEMFATGAMQNYKGVHDPLYARVLIMDNGKIKAAMVTLDLGGVPGGTDLVTAITAELKIKPEHLFLTATHNHSAPSAGRGGASAAQPNLYYELIKRNVLQAVRTANSQMQLAEVGYKEGKAYINTNRYQRIGEDFHMGYNPDGPSDKTVSVLTFISKATKLPIAIYSNYAVHAVVMYRAKTKDGGTEVTGDIAGATSNYVEAKLKNVVSLWTSGAAGDQNPIFMANYNQDAPDVHDTGAAGYAILDVLARRLGEEIVRLATSTVDTKSEVVLWGKQKVVSCPGQRNPNPQAPGAFASSVKASEVKMVDGDPVNIPISLLMINDIALAGVSGEVFTEIGQHLKRESIFDRTVMVTHTPGGVGYIATDAAYLLPSEKAVGNRIKPGCAENAIIGGFAELMRDYVAVQKQTVAEK